MKHYFLRFILLTSVIWFSHGSYAQDGKKTPAFDSMQKQAGFINTFYDASSDRIYLQISDFDKPLIFQSSLPRGVGSNDIGLDRGQLGDTRLIEFERYGNKVFIKQLNTAFRANSDNMAEQKSIDEAFADSIIAGLTIASENENGVVVDYTDFLFSDIHGIGERLTQRKQGKFKVDPKRSGVFLERTKSFPLNTELEALVTFTGSEPGEYVKQVSPDPDIISVHLHHSFIALPDDNYEMRQFHPFSGFWKHSFYDYSVAIEEPIEQRLIPRHRLAKKDPSLAQSDAVEPIVYYLDPGIPEPVMSALKDGALWWNEAFEAIGYKNAFQVKVLPEHADPMDIRYNVIQWVHRATRGWSYGSSVIDPRTGEILKGHVTLGSLRVRQDYLIALGLTSPFTSGNEDASPQREMALARIRQLSAHEVGHTLGIAHNFAASEYGRASVMDYPHPRVVLSDGKIQLEDAYDTGMGAWDLHTIAYGYQDFPNDVSENEALTDIINKAYDNGFTYKSDPDARSPYHPSADGHLWDNGSDANEEFSRIADIRAHALKRFGLDVIPSGTPLSDLEEYLVPLYYAHRYQLDAVVKLIGGIDYQYEVKSERDIQGQSAVTAARQHQALKSILQSMDTEFLTLPEHVLKLVIPKVYGSMRNRESFNGRTGRMFDPVSAAESAAAYSAKLLLAPERLNRVAWQYSQDDEQVSVAGIINQLLEVSWKKKTKDTSAISQRVKLVIIDAIMDTVQSDALSPENRLSIEGTLMNFTAWLDKNDRTPIDRAMLNHLQRYWRTGEWLGGFDAKPLPPGSPI